MNYTQEDILNSAKIGYEFEFLSKENPVDIARSLSKVLGIRVVVPMNIDDIKKDKLKYHTPVITTPNLFKLESDFSGGKFMKELVTGPLAFPEAKQVLLKVLNWINDNAWTTERAACQLNISFDKWKIKLNNDISHINTLKFCLNFNENFVYKRFPNRKDSVYGKSIKHIVINNIFNINISNANSQFTIAPTKYYSVNLTKIPNGYVEFRFIGGAEYQKKKQQIIEILEFSILSLFSATQNTQLSQNDINKLQKILDKNKKFLDAYKNPESFRTLFPHINLSFDLLKDIETYKTMWPHVKDKLFMFLINAGCEKMDINYDSDEGILQVKEADLKFAECTNIEFLHCTGYGIFTKCKFYDSKLQNSHIYECEMMRENIIKDSKIENTNLYKTNAIYDTYITNDKPYIINCKIEGGVFRKGTIGPHCQLSDTTSVVDVDNEKPKKYKGTFGVYKTPDERDHKQSKVLFVTPKKPK